MMAGYVLFAVMRHARDIPAFERAQREHRWHYIHPRDPETITVGVLGLGELGLTAALECARQGYRVRGWSNTLKSVEGIETSAGLSALPDILGDSDILVCMLPQTPQTRGLLNAERLAQMKRGAVFINVSRGSIVDEPALIEALRSGHIAEATLDVFRHRATAAGESALGDGQCSDHAASRIGGAAGFRGTADRRECAPAAVRAGAAKPRRSAPGLLSPARIGRQRQRRRARSRRMSVPPVAARGASDAAPSHAWPAVFR